MRRVFASPTAQSFVAGLALGLATTPAYDLLAPHLLDPTLLDQDPGDVLRVILMGQLVGVIGVALVLTALNAAPRPNGRLLATTLAIGSGLAVLRTLTAIVGLAVGLLLSYVLTIWIASK